MFEDVIDRIYEAAFVPDQWPRVLASLSALSGSASSAVLVLARRQAPRWRGTDIVQESLHDFHVTGDWERTLKPSRYIAKRFTGFVCDVDLLSPEQLLRDPINQRLAALGLGWQMAALLPMPGDQAGFITFERRIEDGRHRRREIATLEKLRPHLARAMLLSARLGLEPAKTAVATLEAVGLPAIVLTAAGRVLAANGLVETLSSILLATAHGGLAVAHPAANALFREALASQAMNGGPVRSIAVPADEGREAVIIHLLPLRGAAHDIFSGAAVLLIATTLSITAKVPDVTLLHGLFDLSPVEARLAGALASGRTLKEAAADQGIRISTARAYLNAIFRKTGTRQQSQLVALLKSTQPLIQ